MYPTIPIPIMRHSENRAQQHLHDIFFNTLLFALEQMTYSENAPRIKIRLKWALNVLSEYW